MKNHQSNQILVHHEAEYMRNRTQFKPIHKGKTYFNQGLLSMYRANAQPPFLCTPSDFQRASSPQSDNYIAYKIL